MAKAGYCSPEDLSFLISFIRAVEKHPCLWNSSLQEYNKADVTGLAWKDISAEFKEAEQKCRERWKNIRCAFVRSLKPPKSGLGRTKKKAYYLAEYLSFLIPHAKIYSSFDDVSTMKGESDISYPYYEDNNVSSDSETAEQKNVMIPITQTRADDLPTNNESTKFLEKRTAKIKNIRSNVDEDTFIEDGNSKRPKQNKEEEDGDLLFFRSILPDFKKLDSKRKRDLKVKFMTLLNTTLDDAESKSLSNFSS